jgi:ClpP class serine protease
MSIRLPHIAARLFDAPLLIDPRKLAAIASALGARVVDGGFSLINVAALDHAAFAGGRPSQQMGVVSGRLGRGLNRTAMARTTFSTSSARSRRSRSRARWSTRARGSAAMSGDTSYQGLQTQVAVAARSPNIKGAVFEHDSFGGEGAGAFETADMIARLSAIKPTLAILTDFACSASYLLASACRQIVMPEGGAAGSIGVVSMHADFSKQLEADGVKVTLIASGEHKTEGNPFEPLPADVLRPFRRATMRRASASPAVGTYRGARFSKAAALATEAQTYNSAEALSLGLVDGIVDSPVEAFATFVDAINRA